MPEAIVKRNGQREAWEPRKIRDAVLKSFETTTGSKEKKSWLNAEMIKELVLAHINGTKEISQEEVQDLVEKSLMKSGFFEEAANYIKYREKRREIREQKNAVLDIEKMISEYVDKEDWRIHENSNVDYSYQGLTLNINGKVQSTYMLNKYPNEVSESHLEGYVHIHDLDFSLTGYCSGWSLYDLILEGFNAPGGCNSGPPKHFDTVLSQAINFIGTLQNEWAGAQAFSSFDTLTAPFIWYDKKRLEKELGTEVPDSFMYKRVKQSMQRFMFNMNTTSRWGGQTPFSNLTFDLTPNKPYKDMNIIIGGQPQEYTYNDFQKEMEMVNRAFLEVLKEGDYENRIFTFPIPTYNITPDFPWDSEIGQLILEVTAKYGAPYFQNFINSDISPEDVRSFCVTGDTAVRVKWLEDGSIEDIEIGELLEDHEIDDFHILTSQGYRAVERGIKKKCSKLVKIVTESGKTLKMSPDHPHLVYKDSGGLCKIQAKYLRKGMGCSMKRNLKGDNNPNYGNNWNENKKEYMSELKKEFYEDNPEKRPLGDKNGMYGKRQSEETKRKISENLKGRQVTENFREFRRKDWSGKGNPVASQNYWNKKDFYSNNKQISPLEEIIVNFLDANEVGYVFQKVFDDVDRVWVADFYIPEKNLIVECESGCNGCYYNEKSVLREDKFDFYVDEGYNVLVVNPEVTNEWMEFLNHKEEIVEVKKLRKKNWSKYTVYDVEIMEEEGKYKVHDFYANEILTHNCCRLRLDKQQVQEHLERLENKTGGLFGAGELTGSIGVVTLNLPKLAHLAKNEDEFFDYIRKYANIAKNSLEFKRKMLNNNLEKGMFPWTKRYLKSGFDSHFSTIGVVGGHEACLNLLGKGIETQEGLELSKKTLNYMRELMLEFQRETGNMYNLEASPAEGASYRLAKVDNEMHSNITQSGEDDIFYTNSTQLSPDFDGNVFDIINHQNELQPLYTGGTVQHVFIGEKEPDLESLKKFITRVFTNTELPYISITPTFSICPNHGYMRGENFDCPTCGEECEVYTRVVGYLRPVNRFNKGKKEEFKQRETYPV